MDTVERKRDRLEIIHDILSTIRDRRNSIRPTPLLRYSNLSSKSFTEYLTELESKGLIKTVFDDKKRKYITLTDTGFHYLEKYEYIKGFINEFDL